jgi:RNA polymerase sigma-70 factor (ECF subfamily)
VSTPEDPHRESGGPDFGAVYRQHLANVHGFFTYRVQSRELAEDLTQQTFERALIAWPRYDVQRSKPLTWLLAIARNLLIDHYRAAAGRSQEPIESHENTLAGPAPEPPGVSAELQRCLDLLTFREREFIALRFAGDLTGPEIAEITGLTLGNVQQILSRAQRKLRDSFDRSAGGA